MRYLLYLGCLIPYRELGYEISARRVAPELGIELLDMPDFNCCGFPVESISHEAMLLLAARNLAIAEEEGLDILTLCNGCFSTLLHAKHELEERPGLKEWVNEKLAKTGLEVKGDVEVKHIVHVLVEDVGVDKIRDRVVRPLEGLVVAQHTGCHLVRPRELMAFDDPDEPRVLKELIEATGARCVSYPDEGQCCGGPILGVDVRQALRLVADKLGRIKETGAQALITVCPDCHFMYDFNQPEAEKQSGQKFGLPVLYYTQLLGLAIGLKPEELGLKMLRVKADRLLEPLGI
ncbi:CoB--CoM heterodisulfide reductase subunit B [Candidatus Bathyarchaeota archaeon]|nr:MAG: CoB--CoM heterodisulfide reductase subunit B [Candidatus Bathyarchaeota archaeon]